MKLSSEFIRLPLNFDVAALQREAAQFSESDWDRHPQSFEGNSALILVSAHGGRNNHYNGPMQATSQLARCEYIQQVLASFGSVIGRSRLMRLDPGCQVQPHCDVDYSWRHRVRIHVPIITDDHVMFESIGNRAVHMRAGESWIFDNWKEHAVHNNGTTRRIHLVVDTTGSAKFWQMVEQGSESCTLSDATFVPYRQEHSTALSFERYNSMPVRSPDEVDGMMMQFENELHPTPSVSDVYAAHFISRAKQFRHEWRGNWLLHGDRRDGLGVYKNLIRDLKTDAKQILGEAQLASNHVSASKVITNWLDALVDEKALQLQATASAEVDSIDTAQFDRPVFIVAAPRSGSTMLFETLSQNIEFWTIGDESHSEFESIRALHPAASKFSSNELGAEHAKPSVVAKLLNGFLNSLKNARGTLYSEIPAETRTAQFRFLEKTPKNALRIKFLRSVFPDAKFIFLHRAPRQNIASIIEAWQSGRFVTYPKLPGWQGLPWSLLLPAGWREFNGASVAKIAAFQWAATNKKIRDDLSILPSDSWCSVSYEQLTTDKVSALRKLCEFADVPFGPRMQNIARSDTPLSQYTVTSPNPEKWRRYESEILEVLPDIQAEIDALGY